MPLIDNKNFNNASRKSPRLPEYDYSHTGYYFVTICVQGRGCLFGEVINDAVCLNDVGKMVGSVWMRLPDLFEQVDLDLCVVMPNHLHGIIVLEKGINLTRVIQAFKSVSTNEYIRGVHQRGWKTFNRTLWQRSFYDHVIRNDKDLSRVQEYILNNPLSWALDEENPDLKGRRNTGRTQGPPLRTK